MGGVSPLTVNLRAAVQRSAYKLPSGVAGCSRLYFVQSTMFGKMEAYQPPEWTGNLSYIPTKRIRLATNNTHIHPWTIRGAPAEFSVGIKRDDLTGCPLSGNKVRKLEFLMADAVDQGCSHVITCGSLQSNHCRAVALCARQLGITPHLFLRTDVMSAQEAGCEGNMLIDRLCGARIFLVPRRSPFLTHLMPRMQRWAQHLLSTQGEASYLIPVGGSNKTGLFGYISAFEELRQQGVLEQYDDLVFTCGSGGTAAGLAIGNHLTGAQLRLHGICVSDDAAYFYHHIDQMLHEVGLGDLHAKDMLRILEGHKGKGYGLSTRQELDFIHQVAMDTSIILDPVYTGKAALAMVTEMTRNPTSFKGRRVLFIHTGGIFGLFDGRMTPVINEKEDQQPLITMWPDMGDPPF